MTENVRSEISDSVAVITLDDGKANAISHAVVEGLSAHFDRAEKESKAVLITGRPGMFSGGFDLAVMRGGPEDVYALVHAGGELFCRFLDLRIPIVVAATGHAIAAGAICLLAADARFGAAGRFRIGLNEVANGMTLPVFAAELARQRLSKRHFVRACSQAELYDPETAVDAGYLDRVVPPDQLFDAAFAEAVRLGDLAQPAFGVTKRRLHAKLVAHLRETLEPDLRELMGLKS
jgi:enoyl-CoA hydratase